MAGGVPTDGDRERAIQIVTSKCGPISLNDIAVDRRLLPLPVGWEGEFEHMLVGCNSPGPKLILFNGQKGTVNFNYPQLPNSITNSLIRFPDGSHRSFAETARGLIVLNLFEPWDGPSVEQIPWLNDLSSEFISQGVRVLAVSTDMHTSDADFWTFGKRRGVRFELGRADETFLNEFAKLSKADVIPQTIILKDGRIRGVFLGAGARVNSQVHDLVRQILENKTGN